MVSNKKAIARKPVPLSEFTIPEVLPHEIAISKHLIAKFFSKHLEQFLRVEIYLPIDYLENTEAIYPLLVLNDGQDMQDVKLMPWLHHLQQTAKMQAAVVVAVYANKHRKFMYGVSDIPDYLERGDRAGDYMRFISLELLPYIETHYRVSIDAAQRAIAGFSLGGLMAFDIALVKPELFQWVGVFSGSFWWRAKAYNNGYTDADRIMHARIAEVDIHPNQHFWLQTGTHDEQNDRDKDGIIDAISDSLDVIAALEYNGHPQKQIKYIEVDKGEHNPRTWAALMGDFLSWLWQ